MAQGDKLVTLDGLKAVHDYDAAQVSELKSAVDNTESIIDDLTTEQYSVLSGTDVGYKVINSNKVVADSTATTWHVVSYAATLGQKFRISGSTNNNNYWFIFTDGTNTLSSSKQNTTGGAASINDVYAIAPTGTTTLVVAYNTGAAHTNAQAKLITGYEIDDVEALEERVEAIEDLCDTVSENHLVVASEYTEHSDSIMYTTGVSTTSDGWRYIEYTIPDNAKSIIVTAKAGQSLRLWILKNSGGTVLGYSDDSSNVSVKTETINLSSYATAKKLFVNDKESSDLTIVYTYDAKSVDGDKLYVDGINLKNIVTGDKLFKKVLCCCGDSITYGADMDSAGIAQFSDITVYQSDYNGDFAQVHSNFLRTWGYDIAERHSMTFYNAGVSGSTMQGIADKHGFSLANGRYTKLPESIDYLLIWFGWNDYAHGTLGQITDNTNESFYGGYNVVLPYLIDKYPYAKIGLIVPFGGFPDHREAVRLLGNKWGVAVFDNYQGGTPLYFGKESSVGVDADIVAANKEKFQANGAHPNSHGHKQLADMIEHWMQGI